MDTSQHTIALLQLAFMAVITLAAWAYVIIMMRRGAEYNSAVAPAPQHLSWGPLHVCLVASIFLVLPAVVVQLAAADRPNTELELAELDLGELGRLSLIAGTALCIFTLLALALFRLGRIADRRAIGFPRSSAWPAVLAGICGFCLLAAPSYILQMLFSQLDGRVHPVIEQLQKSPDLDYFISMTISVVLLAPLAEEIVFRVVLQGWLETVIPIGSGSSPGEPADTAEQGNPIHWRAIAISAGLFAVVHLPAGIGGVIPLFLYALGLGYVYQRTGQLISCVLMHMLLNAFTMLALYITLFS